MTHADKPRGSGVRLSMVPGGITTIGPDGGDVIVAGHPDGAIYVGTPDRPMLGRQTDGVVLVTISEDYAVRVMPDGAMDIYTGRDALTFVPGNDVMITDLEENVDSYDVLRRLEVLGRSITKIDMNFDRSQDGLDPLRISTQPSGSAMFKRANSQISVIGRQDGSVYVGTMRKPYLGRLPTGEIMVMMADDFAAIIKSDGTIVLATETDCMEYRVGGMIQVVTGEAFVTARNIIERLDVLSRDIIKVPAHLPPRPQRKEAAPVATSQQAVNEFAQGAVDDEVIDILQSDTFAAAEEVPVPAEEMEIDLSDIAVEEATSDVMIFGTEEQEDGNEEASDALELTAQSEPEAADDPEPVEALPAFETVTEVAAQETLVVNSTSTSTGAVLVDAKPAPLRAPVKAEPAPEAARGFGLPLFRKKPEDAVPRVKTFNL